MGEGLHILRKTGSLRSVAPLVWMVLAALCFSIGSLQGRDVFVFISGGVSPWENNYSQFLQARAVVAAWRQAYPPESVWVFFGAGNTEGQAPVFADVRQQTVREGLLLDQWLPGVLPRNRPARRNLILRAFREEILPAVAEGGTVFLFVGDHGARPRDESIVNLWSMEPDAGSEHGWRNDEDATLGVGELRRLLTKGLGRGRMVFCMTQCHSGGFHYLAIPRTMSPDPKWFKRVPAWVQRPRPATFLAVAGFTATDEYSAAAGCNPAPTVDDWAGYERFLPERLFGLDLFTLASRGSPLDSFVQAHQAATLVDSTIDHPYATSEQYLERWAELIEKRLSKEPALSTRVKQRVAVYHQAVNGGKVRQSDRSFRERQAMFDRFTQALAEQNHALTPLLLKGTRQQLEAAIEGEEMAENGPPRTETPSWRRRRGERSAVRALWQKTIQPAWSAAVQAHQVDDLLGAAAAFEKFLLANKAEDGRDFFLAPQDEVDREVFWHSGYSDPKSVDRVKAEAIVRWGTTRRDRIVAWAKASQDEALRAAAQRLPPRRPRVGAEGSLAEPLSRKTAAKRVLFYRRVLAAWEFLLDVHERPALERLGQLIALERTPLPPAR